MKQPVLVREVDFSSPQERQQAVGDFNKKGTAELTPAERAVSDSRRISQDTLDHVAGLLEDGGDNASVSSIATPQLVDRLVNDGVISPNERAGLVQSNGTLTSGAKDRFSKLLTGRFFRDSEQFDNTAPSIRNKLERIAAPLAKVEGGAFSLAEPMQEALDLLEEARAHGQTNLDELLGQKGLFGQQKYSPEGIALAKALRDLGPKQLGAMAKQYAQDASYASGGNLFGDAPTPGQAFNEAFPKK